MSASAGGAADKVPTSVHVYVFFVILEFKIHSIAMAIGIHVQSNTIQYNRIFVKPLQFSFFDKVLSNLALTCNFLI